MFRFAHWLLRSTQAPEDVTHDCFLSLIENRDGSILPELRIFIAAKRNLAAQGYNSFGRDTSESARRSTRRVRLNERVASAAVATQSAGSFRVRGSFKSSSPEG